MTEPLRIFLVDDEAPARARLHSLLDDCAESVATVVVGEADSGAAALAGLQVTPADLVLLDIRMPGMDGMEVAKRLSEGSQPPQIVFVTAYDAHAVSAFEVGAKDYLLKPVRLERLVEALRRVRPVAPSGAGGKRDHFVVSDRGRVLRVPVEDVLYLRAELKYVTLRTRDREYVLDEPLTKLEDEFSGDFLRVHRNCLINRSHLTGFELQRVGEETRWMALIKDWPEALKVSRRQAHVVREFRCL